MHIPKHIGVIPDGNRRWAVQNGLSKEKGYEMGLKPGLELLKLCKENKIKEITYYGFTIDNTKRPVEQRIAFTAACVEAVKLLSIENASLLVIGNSNSPMFPKELLPFIERKVFGKEEIRVNFLVNYSYEWDLSGISFRETKNKSNLLKQLNSHDVSRIDLVIRWGGRRRLSGFLPVQTVYSDFYVLDDYWPDFKPQHFYDALDWYSKQDITLGG